MNPNDTSPNTTNATATAYALGELTAAERAAFEQQMENDPALAALARETREFCSLLDGTLRDPVPSLAEENRAALLAAAAGRRRKSIIWIPWLAGAAAACVAGGFYFNNQFVTYKSAPGLANSPRAADSILPGAGGPYETPTAAKKPAVPPASNIAARQVPPAMREAAKELRYGEAHIAAAMALAATVAPAPPANESADTGTAPPPGLELPANPATPAERETAIPVTTAPVAPLITIKPDMPKALFTGTPLPENNRPKNLDVSGRAVREMKVPAGVTLVSKGKPVTCSDPAPLGELSLITDGDKDGDDGYFVDILPGKQWVQIDLGQRQEIHLIWLWHYHKADVIYNDVVVQISDDPEFKKSATVFNNDWDNTSGFGVGKDQSWVETNNGRPVPVSGVTGRYVRCWSNGRNIDDTNHYIEVEVYARPPGAATAASAPPVVAEADPKKREELTQKAWQLERDGDRLFTKQDFAGAIAQYRTAFDAFPDSSAGSPDRNRAAGKYGNACVILARELGQRGEFDKAKALLTEVLDVKVAPHHQSARILLAQLNDPARFKQSLDPAAYANNEEVRKLLNKGLGYYDLGQFHEAEEVFNHILTIDPYNTDARRSVERIQNASDYYLKSARDETRLRMLNSVDSLWVTEVPNNTSASTTAPAPQAEGNLKEAFDQALTIRPAMPKPLFAGTPLPDSAFPANLAGGIPADNAQLPAPPPMVPANPATMSGAGMLVAGNGGGRARGVLNAREGTGSGGGIGSGWTPATRNPDERDYTSPPRSGRDIVLREGDGERSEAAGDFQEFPKGLTPWAGLAGPRPDLSRQVAEVEKSRQAMIDLGKKHNINDMVPYNTTGTSSPVIQPGLSQAEQARQYETRLAADVLKMSAQLQALQPLKGEPLIAGAAELGVSNGTIQKLFPEYQAQKVARASLLASGFDEKHPKVQGLTESINESYKQLELAAESYKNSLNVQIGTSKKMLDDARARTAQKDADSLTERQNQLEYVQAKQRYEEEMLKLQAMERQAAQVEAPGTESYQPIIENPFLPVLSTPLSTFSIDVDTASYSNVRRFLNMGQCPPPDAVRLEELVNYFPYDYAQPVDGKPFAVHVEMTSAPWDETHRIARIALKGKEIPQTERPAANLVFLVDVSGSMQPENKLPLVKQSLKFVVERLTQKDTVSLVTYAGESGVALPATSGGDKARIMSAIDALGAGGSTNGAGGITTAYQQAAQHFNKEGINRVILATDGDFNVGVTSHNALLQLITEKAKTGVFLSVLGYGMGNTKDDTMELLADKGNGNYAYIDGLSEARKALGEQFTGTLVTIAKDVKIQIEFNPAIIRSYRLLGYENRMLAKEDFNNDKKDAGEIGAGHTVTALYELVPVGALEARVLVDDLKYQPKPAQPAPLPAPPDVGGHGETMNIKLRWKAPDADVSQLMEVPLKDTGAKIDAANPETKWAVAVAGFAAMLNGSQFNGLTWEQIRTLAKAGKGADPNGYRGEFLQLIDRAESVRR